MSKKTLYNYELGRKTNADILKNEEADVDDVEVMQEPKKDTGRSVDYKKRHQDFLRNAKISDSDIDINEIKKVQMQVYASNSSDVYNLTSKTSIFFTVLSIIFAILLFAVVLFYAVFTTAGYKIVKYESEDMSPTIRSGEVLVTVDLAKVNAIKQYDLVVIKTDVGYKARIVTDVGTEIKLNTPNDANPESMKFDDFQNVCLGIVSSRINFFGTFLKFVLDYWYFVSGGLFLLMLGCFVTKLFIDRHYNLMLINKIEREKEQMEKRRKFLSENILKMNETKNANFDNMKLLSGALNINKKADTKRDKKMQKLQTQLKDRQQQQVERIKNKEEVKEPDDQKRQEEQVVAFLREEISAKEKQSKAVLSEEEIERRRKLAEETNKKMQD